MNIKIKARNIIYCIITKLFLLSELFLILLTGIFAIKELLSFNFNFANILNKLLSFNFNFTNILNELLSLNFNFANICNGTKLIFKIITPFILYCNKRRNDKKILDSWTPTDYILLVIAILTVTSYTQETEGIEFYILSIAFVLYTFLGMIIIIYNNTYIITIVILCMVYGSIDNNSYEIFIVIVTYILSNLNKDDIQKLLNIRNFENKKFIEDKFKASIAIISTAFTNLIGNKIWDMLGNNKIGISGLILIFLKGYFRFMFFMIMYASIIYLLNKNKPKLKIRYTKYISILR